jgi:hypothetical protein
MAGFKTLYRFWIVYRILEAWYGTAHIFTAETLCRIPPENMKQKAKHVGWLPRQNRRTLPCI